ncbi:histidine phosphatase family protein [Mycolicibacterium litorale]|uniref:histidine phosphatase family protein n=1 Tax=Mycolicibacterium litorale TaxID=758802 RepID=UPI003CED8F38
MGVIYLVRHGQAPAQAYGSSGAAQEFTGLTELGREQARLAGEALAARIGPLTAAFSGDLARQRETLDGVLTALGSDVAPQCDPRWNEYDIAAVLGGGDLAVTTTGSTLQGILDSALEEWATRPSGDGDLESFADYRSRCSGALSAVQELAGSGQTVLVVSSSGTITQILAQLWAMSPQSWIPLARTMVNASITKLIVGRRGVSVVSVNEHAHLDTPDDTGARPVLTFR